MYLAGFDFKIRNKLITFYYYFIFSIVFSLASPQCQLLAAEQQPFKYVVLGDSMIKTGFGQALKSRFASTLDAKVKIFGKSSSGLARPDLFDWHQALDQELKTYPKDASAYVMIGANDCQDFSKDGKSIPFGSAEWTEIYLERLERFSQSLCKNLKEVFWFGLPPMKLKKYNQKIIHLNNITEDFLKSQRCVRYIPTKNILGTKDGRFQNSMNFKNKNRPIRESDGIHLSYHGAQILVDYILKEKIF